MRGDEWLCRHTAVWRAPGSAGAACGCWPSAVTGGWPQTSQAFRMPRHWASAGLSCRGGGGLGAHFNATKGQGAAGGRPEAGCSSGWAGGLVGRMPGRTAPSLAIPAPQQLFKCRLGCTPIPDSLPAPEELPVLALCAAQPPRHAAWHVCVASSVAVRQTSNTQKQSCHASGRPCALAAAGCRLTQLPEGKS